MTPPHNAVTHLSRIKCIDFGVRLRAIFRLLTTSPMLRFLCNGNDSTLLPGYAWKQLFTSIPTFRGFHFSSRSQCESGHNTLECHGTHNCRKYKEHLTKSFGTGLHKTSTNNNYNNINHKTIKRHPVHLKSVRVVALFMIGLYTDNPTCSKDVCCSPCCSPVGPSFYVAKNVHSNSCCQRC